MLLRLERGGAMQVVENQFLKFCFMRGPNGVDQQKKNLFHKWGKKFG
jgi:hypothetical protein